MDTFAFLRIGGRQRDWGPVHEALLSALPAERIWGAFHGLFGVGSNEIIAVTVGDDAAVAESIETVAGLDAVERVESLTLVPTVRPTDRAPLTREGLYVFRFFDVAHRDVEEIASLRRPRGPPSRPSTHTVRSPRASSASATVPTDAAGCCCSRGTTD